jgi:hypothetical protein
LIESQQRLRVDELNLNGKRSLHTPADAVLDALPALCDVPTGIPIGSALARNWHATMVTSVVWSAC